MQLVYHLHKTLFGFQLSLLFLKLDYKIDSQFTVLAFCRK
ncbi:hypothetical protein ADICYQ_3481 [Cyclobacterium qasimii M12-11B]|uniref:Uncharacterized protein n=1 Tax=Cyclobacterium qasimii M12-11B TaxID=641524 RepID=S7VD08_9BACT|nr:hypothetical protein ADICYQ_3481 [Cyclobacterium qasimii M12-11B]